MREIKFRAWYKEAEEMHNVRDINFCGEELDTYEMEGDWLSFDDVILMQYTGLCDKNGKEIYEGDVVNITGRKDTYKIVFGMGCFKMSDIAYPNRNLHLLEDVFTWVKVICNIYENPELLEVDT